MDSNHSPRFSYQELSGWKLHESRNLQKAIKRRDSLIDQMRRKGIPPELLGHQILRFYRQTRECGNNGNYAHLKERLNPQKNVVNWTKHFELQIAPLISKDWYSTHRDDEYELPNPDEAERIMHSIANERGHDRANANREERMMAQYVDDLIVSIRQSHFTFLAE